MKLPHLSAFVNIVRYALAMKVIFLPGLLVCAFPVASQNYLSLLKELEVEARKFKAGQEIKFMDNDPSVWSYQSFIELYNFKNGTDLDPSISDPGILDYTIEKLFGSTLPPDLIAGKKIYDQVRTLEEKMHAINSGLIIRRHAIRELKGIKLPMEEYFADREDKSDYPKEKERLKNTFTVDQLTDQINKLKSDSVTNQENLSHWVSEHPASSQYVRKEGPERRNLTSIVNKPAERKFAKWYEAELIKIQAQIKEKFLEIPPEALIDLAEANEIIQEHISLIEKWDEHTRDKNKMFKPSVKGYGSVRLICARIKKFGHLDLIKPFMNSAEALMKYVEINRKYYLFFMFISGSNETVAGIRVNTGTTNQSIEMTVKAIADMKEVELGQLTENEAKYFQGFTFSKIILTGLQNHTGLELLETEIVEIRACNEINAYDLHDFNKVKGIKTLKIQCKADCKCKIRNLKDIQNSLNFQLIQT